MTVTNEALFLLAASLLLAGLGAVLIALYFRSRGNPLLERLAFYRGGGGAELTEDASVVRGQGLELTPRQRALLTPIISMGERLSGTDTDRRKLRKLLAMGGFRTNEALGLLVSGKYLLGFSLALFMLFAVLGPQSRFGLSGLACGLVAMFVGTLLPEVWLKWRSARRGGRLERTLPDALDLMVICAEAGLPLGRVLQVVSREMALSAPELADELRYTHAELQIVNDRPRALNNLAYRTGISGIESMVSTLIQAERYGTPLSQALRTISDESRKELVLTLEERAGKLPAQLSVPLMGLILPPIVAMMGAPAMVRIIRLLSQ